MINLNQVGKKCFDTIDPFCIVIERLIVLEFIPVKPMDKKSKEQVKSISLQAIIISLLFLASLGIFALLTHEIVFEKEDWFDSRTFTFLKNHSSPGIIFFFKQLTFLGSSYFLFPAYIILIGWLLFKKRKTDAITIAIIAISSTLLMYILKLLIGRVRPDLPLFEPLSTNSFPSGHSLSSFIFCSVIVWLVWKSKWGIKLKWILSGLLLLLAISVGISRIVLRYHYASDVLAGFCMGFAWVLLSFWVQKKMLHSSASSHTANMSK